MGPQDYLIPATLTGQRKQVYVYLFNRSFTSGRAKIKYYQWFKKNSLENKNKEHLNSIWIFLKTNLKTTFVCLLQNFVLYSFLSGVSDFLINAKVNLGQQNPLLRGIMYCLNFFLL